MATSAAAATAIPLLVMVALPLTAVQLARTTVQVPLMALDMAPAQVTAPAHLITVRALVAATAAAIAMPGIVVLTR